MHASLPASVCDHVTDSKDSPTKITRAVLTVTNSRERKRSQSATQWLSLDVSPSNKQTADGFTKDPPSLSPPPGPPLPLPPQLCRSFQPAVAAAGISAVALALRGKSVCVFVCGRAHAVCALCAHVCQCASLPVCSINESSIRLACEPAEEEVGGSFHFDCWLTEAPDSLSIHVCACAHVYLWGMK